MNGGARVGLGLLFSLKVAAAGSFLFLAISLRAGRGTDAAQKRGTQASTSTQAHRLSIEQRKRDHIIAGEACMSLACWAHTE